MSINSEPNSADGAHDAVFTDYSELLPGQGVEADNVTETIAAAEQLETRARAYVEHTLPATETRIPEPMDPSCEVSLVIPAYSERDNIMRRPLASLAQQTARPDQFEVIVVVNNPPSRPTRDMFDSDGEFMRKAELYDDGVADNQATIQLIQALKTGEAPDDLSPEDRALFDEIHASGIHVHVIDKSTPGHTLEPEDANVGGARDRGVAEAVERFLRAQRNGIIAQSDADVRFDEHYIQGLIDAYAAHPDVVGLQVEVELEKSIELAELLPPLVDTVSDEYRHLYYGSFVPIVNETHRRPAEPTAPFYYGPGMTSRAFEAGAAGGVPHIAGGEDPAFGDALTAIGRTASTKAAKVYQLDRFSARTAANAGQGQARIAMAEEWQASGRLTVDNPGTALAWRHISNALEAARTGAVDTQPPTLTLNGTEVLDAADMAIVRQLAPHAESVGQLLGDRDMAAITTKLHNWVSAANPRIEINAAAEQVIDKILEVEPQLHTAYEEAQERALAEEERFVAMRAAVVEVAFDATHAGDDIAPSQRIIAALTDNADSIGLPAEILEQIAQDPELLAALAETAAAATPGEAINTMRTRYPELDPPSENPLKQTLVKVRAMRRVVTAAGFIANQDTDQ